MFLQIRGTPRTTGIEGSMLLVFNSLFIQLLFLQIRGTPWTTDYRDRRINVTNLETVFDVKDAHNPAFNATVQQTLQPGTNCTFYLCYKQNRVTLPFSLLGKTASASCITGKSLHIHTHTRRSSFIRQKPEISFFSWFSATHRKCYYKYASVLLVE